AELREARRDALTQEEVRKLIFKLAAHTPEPPSWLVKVGASSGVTGVPSALWSDWHLGEVVRLEEMNGVNAFNLGIAEKRIRRRAERQIDLCYAHMTSPRYPGIVVGLAGDIISGGLHPELAESDELDIVPTVFWAVDRLTWALRVLADKFGFVYVVCSPG